MNHRKRIAILLLTMMMVLTFSGCSSLARRIQAQINNTNNQGMVDALYYDYADGVDYYVFCAGDRFLVSKPGTPGWANTYSNPTGLNMAEGEFALVNADVTYVSGGVAGYMNAPSLTKIKSQKIVSVDDVENAGSLAAYNPAEEYFSGVKIHKDGGFVYILACAGYERFRLYKNGRFTEEYSTTYDAEVAMGLRTKADSDAEMEHYGHINILVWRCGDKYLIYTGNVCFNEELGVWREFLNEEFGDKPLDFTLEEGEAVYMTNAELMRVNGGNGNYYNQPMYIGCESMETIDIDRLNYRISMNHWEEGPASENLESRQYGVGDAVIIKIEDNYYVFADENCRKEVTPGVYNSLDAVNEAIGFMPD
jgi:hypothetical protein